MKMKKDGISGPAYREDRAAEQLGITVNQFREYADRLGIRPRRNHGQRGSWYLVFELEEIADLMGLTDRKWSNPMRGYRSQGSKGFGFPRLHLWSAGSQPEVGCKCG